MGRRAFPGGQRWTGRWFLSLKAARDARTPPCSDLPPQAAPRSASCAARCVHSHSMSQWTRPNVARVLRAVGAARAGVPVALRCLACWSRLSVSVGSRWREGPDGRRRVRSLRERVRRRVSPPWTRLPGGRSRPCGGGSEDGGGVQTWEAKAKVGARLADEERTEPPRGADPRAERLQGEALTTPGNTAVCRPEDLPDGSAFVEGDFASPLEACPGLHPGSNRAILLRGGPLACSRAGWQERA